MWLDLDTRCKTQDTRLVLSKIWKFGVGKKVLREEKNKVKEARREV